jgi:hypothetical protein
MVAYTEPAASIFTVEDPLLFSLILCNLIYITEIQVIMYDHTATRFSQRMQFLSEYFFTFS